MTLLEATDKEVKYESPGYDMSILRQDFEIVFRRYLSAGSLMGR
jgi:hypothetical protein